MKIDISDFKKGSFIKLDVSNPDHEQFGPLQIRSIHIDSAEFCTRWDDLGGYSRPLTASDYITRQTITINVVNSENRLLKLRYWLDEVTNPKSAFPYIVFLKATNLTDARKEVAEIMATERLNLAYTKLRTALSSVYGDIFTCANITNNKKAQQVKDLVGQLIEIV